MFVKMRIIILVILLVKFGLDAKPQKSLPDVNKVTVKLLLTCFPDHLNSVIITPNLHQHFIEASWKFGPMGMTLIDENFKPDDDQRLMLHMPTFVLAPRSTRSFEVMLQALKSSSWWHIDALYFIVGNSEEGCEPAAQILHTTWKSNLISTLFLCHERNEGVMLYTYNPYTNRAPHPWQQVEEHNIVDDRWTLFAREYFEGPENCTSVNYDKTQFMDGYKIKTVTTAKVGAMLSGNVTYDFDSLMDKTSSIVIALLSKILLRKLNMTATVNYDNLGYLQGGKAHGFLLKLINGTYDISLATRFPVFNISATYPFLQGTPRILTQQRKFLLPEEKILAFYSTEIWYLTGIVLLFSFVFILVIYKKLEFALAAFDVLRLLLSASLHVPLNRAAMRIFIFSVFQLIIILHATFQGNLSSFLTKPERLYVNNAEDLHTYRYNVLASITFRTYLDTVETGVQNITYIYGVDCSEDVINDPSNACVGEVPLLVEPALKHKLHISESGLPAKYYSFWCRDNWPLKKKINYYLSCLVEAGLYEYFNDRHVNVPLQKLKSREADETSVRYRPIALADMAFAFRLFAFGISISILVFVIEMFPGQKCLRALEKMKNQFS